MRSTGSIHLYGPREKKSAEAPQNLGALRTKKRLKKKLLLLLGGGLLLGCRLLRCLLLSHHALPPSPVIRPDRFHWFLAGPCCGETLLTFSPTRTSSATPRASPRNLFDEDSETLAVVRNDTLTRVGSVASVVATTSSIAIQSVVIPECTHSRQWFAQNIFCDASEKFRDQGPSRRCITC